MTWKIGRRMAFGAVTVLCASALAPAAHAEDFLSALFGAFGGGRPHGRPSRCRSQMGAIPRLRKPTPALALSGGPAYCVRTCDGRYFPMNGSDNQSRAASCNSFCPASETGGLRRQYRQCRHRERKALFRIAECVSLSQRDRCGMHLQRQGQVGLAPVSIENDPTLRKGDIVVGAGGLMAAGRGADRRGASLNFSPVSRTGRARHQRVPVVASE